MRTAARRRQAGFTLAEIVVSLAVLALAVLVGLQALRGPAGPEAAEAIEDLPAAVEALRFAIQAEAGSQTAQPLEGETTRVCWLDYADNGPLWRVSMPDGNVGADCGPFVYVATLTPGADTAGGMQLRVTYLPASGADETCQAILQRAEGTTAQLQTTFLIRR